MVKGGILAIDLCRNSLIECIKLSQLETLLKSYGNAIRSSILGVTR